MEYFPGLTSLELLRKIQEYLGNRSIDPEKIGDRIIFMSNVQRHHLGQEKNDQECISHSEAGQELCEEMRARTLEIHWSWK